MIRILASLLLLLPLTASAASLVDCWDGTRWTTGTCPPQLDIVSTDADASSLDVTYTLAADAATVYFYVGLPTSGQCVRPAISVIKSGAGAVFHDTFSGADTEVDAGTSTVTATGLSADSEYCPHLFAENADGIPPETLSVAARERYSKTTASPVYTPAVPTGLVKWNPGHYMMAKANRTWVQRQSDYDAITNSTAIKGVVSYAYWGQLEPTQDNFVWTSIQQDLDYVKALNVPKRLFIRILDKRESSDGCSNRTYYPAWLDAAGLCVQTDTSKFTYKWWDSTLEAEYIELLQAMAAEFDDDPYFEGVVLLRETGLGGQTTSAPGYNKAAYVQNLKDIASAAQTAFVKSNVILYTNFVNGGGTSDIEGLLAWQNTEGIGQGSPDVAPDCVTINLYCTDGWRDPQRTSGEGGPRGIPAAAYNYVNDNLIGQVPIAWSVEASQLGSNAVGQHGGYAPEFLRQFADQYLGITHMLWVRMDFSSTSIQNWAPTGGIEDVIEANPTLTNTDCPASHVTRGGCLTGGAE